VSRAEGYADAYVAAHQDFIRFVEGLSDEQWGRVGRNFPERLNDEDETRPVGVIAYHIADGERFIMERIQLMMEGKPLNPVNFRIKNAQQAKDQADVSRDEVLAMLRSNEESIVPRVRAIPDSALDVEHQTPVGPATIAQRLERVLIGHMQMHRGSIEAALLPSSAGEGREG